MIRILIVAIVAFVSFLSNAQTAYLIKDAVSKESVPFAKVYPDKGSPFLADIDGLFSLPADVLSFRLHVASYRDTTVEVLNISDQVIYIQPVFQQIQEVRVVAGENPAHRIVDQAIARRKLNNPMENDAFSYESYSKFIFDIDREYLAGIPDSTSDSTLIRMKRFFEDQHLFMLESSSTRTFIPPSRDKEEITAYKVSGFSDPMFSTFASELQSFSFYENQVQLLGKNYVNPIAFGGTNRYLFILEDTTVTSADTTFTIFYRPRKGKNFDGMTGRLYINTKGFAIEKVTASPYADTSGTKLTIVQEYKYTNDFKWFPYKLSTELSMPINVSVEGQQIIGKGSTYIRNVNFDRAKMGKVSFDNVSVVVSEEASELKDNEWEERREFSITDREKRTYQMIDSLSEANDLNRRLSALKVLTEGRIPMGYFNIDISRFLNYNEYEGVRLGAGLETARKLMKPIVIGGYGAYGFRDKAWKYGAYSTVHLYRKKGIRMDLRYQEDLLERGTPGFRPSTLSLTNMDLYRNLFIVNMERQRLAEVSFTVFPKANIKMMLAGNFQRISFTRDYNFFQNDAIFQPNALTATDLAEISGELTWNIREKVMLVGEQRISKGTKFPKIRVRAAKGIPDLFTATQDYWRFNLDITQDIPLIGVGVFSWNLNAGKTIGDVPLFLQQLGNGTGKDWNLSVKNTFETMVPGEFYHSAQVALFTRMDLMRIKTKAKWNEPQFAFHHGIGYGELANRTSHNISLRSMDKGYFEGGLIINGILTSGVTAIGVGGFYHYGHYANADWKQNIVPKIAIAFNL